MRYFAEIAYNGKAYVGWQVQPNGMSVQQMINEALSTILNDKIEVVGCGRTDAGVHASRFFLHFDYDGKFPKAFLNRLNKFLPDDIAFYDLFEVGNDAHVRFDAYLRSYEYHMILRKNPYEINTAYYYPYPELPDLDKMNKAAALLLDYSEFKPFCKTNSDAKTMICQLSKAEWMKQDDFRWIFHISANRFLRGMVRLIVGMCINVGRGKMELDAVKKALDEQSMLHPSYSVPASGLYLTEVKYPKIKNH